MKKGVTLDLPCSKNYWRKSSSHQAKWSVSMMTDACDNQQWLGQWRQNQRNHASLLFWRQLSRRTDREWRSVLEGNTCNVSGHVRKVPWLVGFQKWSRVQNNRMRQIRPNNCKQLAGVSSVSTGSPNFSFFFFRATPSKSNICKTSFFRCWLTLMLGK